MTSTVAEARAVTEEWDVLVIGSGAGGLSAVTVALHGLKVIVAENVRRHHRVVWRLDVGTAQSVDAPRACLQQVLGTQGRAAVEWFIGSQWSIGSQCRALFGSVPGCPLGRVTSASTGRRTLADIAGPARAPDPTLS
jgi:choline dehydrogenase-like flavoprotein